VNGYRLENAEGHISLLDKSNLLLVERTKLW
jgi:hypothetical protein